MTWHHTFAELNKEYIMYQQLINWLHIINSFHLKDAKSFVEIAASQSILSINNIAIAKDNQQYTKYDSIDVTNYISIYETVEFEPADVIVFASPQIVTTDNANEILNTIVENFANKNVSEITHLIILFPTDIAVPEFINSYYVINLYSSVRDYKNSIDYHYISVTNSGLPVNLYMTNLL